MEFAAFLVLYAVVVGVAWLFRSLVNKRDAAAAEAEAAANAAAPSRSKRYADTAAPAVQKTRSLRAVPAFQARLRSSGKPDGRTEPTLNINDDEAMAAALGYHSVDAYHRDDKVPDIRDLEEDVLGSSSN